MRGLALSSDQSGEAGTPRLLAVYARSLSDVRLFHSGFSRPFAFCPSDPVGLLPPALRTVSRCMRDLLRAQIGA
jgi:hypothetical protein